MRWARLGGFAAAVILAATPLLAGPRPGPAIFTGPDLGKVFHQVVLPEYPYEARRNNWSGRGTFRAVVEVSGEVSSVIVVKSTGHPVMDEAVIRAARRWRAKPGRKIEVDFPLAFIAPPRGIPSGGM